MGVLLFGFRNERNITAIFLISLFSSLMMTITRSYKQIRALLSFWGKKQSLEPKDSSQLHAWGGGDGYDKCRYWLNAYHHPDSDARNDSHKKSCYKEWPCWENGLEKISGEFAGTVSLWFQEEADSRNFEKIDEVSAEELRARLRCFNRHDNRSIGVVEFSQIRLITDKFDFVASKAARGHDGTEHICNMKRNSTLRTGADPALKFGGSHLWKEAVGLKVKWNFS